MSIFGGMGTAVSGLQAQASAFTNISDNIANSQTIGYKGVNTSFINYLTNSTASDNGSDSVVAHPDYTNDAQGGITQSSDPLALAIQGQGFFAVSQATGSSAGSGASAATESFSQQQYFTRAGDFALNKDGYLVNSAGDYLNGWSVNPTTGATNTSSLTPIQVSQGTSPPVPTSSVTLAAELPATPTPGQPVSTQVNVYDSLGTMHQLNLGFAQNAANDWTVTVSSPNSNPSTIGTAEIQFGNASPNPVAAGTIGSIGSTTGGVTASPYGTDGPTTLSFNTNFGNGAQAISLDLGNYGGTSGLTQFSGSSFNLIGASQNGTPQGNFSNLAIDAQGNVAVKYSNGATQTVAQIPVATFRSPDALQNQSGEAYTASQGSGTATINAVGGGSSGSLITGSTESSNVNIASEFTKLISAQEAYSANAKVITTSSQLTQTTINMIQ